MKYLVFSDSHGTAEEMINICRTERFDGVLFLGDGTRDVELVGMTFPEKDICAVRGNNDWFGDFPAEAVVRCGNVSILLVHGHTLGVRDGTDYLLKRAKEKGCAVALFGHTHTAYLKKEDGVLLLNPGSVTFKGTYAVLTVSGSDADAAIRQRGAGSD